jgi:hypothetical protein
MLEPITQQRQSRLTCWSSPSGGSTSSVLLGFPTRFAQAAICLHMEEIAASPTRTALGKVVVVGGGVSHLKWMPEQKIRVESNFLWG